MWNSLRVRLTSIFIGLAIIPLIALGGVLAETTYSANKAQAIELESQVAQNAAVKVTDYFQAINQSLFDLGDQIRSLSTPDRTLTSSLMLNELNFGAYGNDFEELALLDSQGREIVRVSHQNIVPDNQLADHSRLDDFIQPVKTRQTYYGPITIDPVTNESAFVIAIPLYETNTGRTTQLSGVLTGKVKLTPLAILLTQAQTGPGQAIYVTDANGNVIAAPNSLRNAKNAHITLPAAGDIQTGLSNPSVVLAVNKIQLGNETFNVVAEQPTSIALSLVNNLINTLFVAILIALLASIALGAVVVRQIVLPVEKLALTAKQIAAGDLSQTASIQSRDEIGTLANAFNDMTAQLRSLVGSLENRVAERTQELERQALRLRTSAEVARDAASAPNLEELLDRSSRLIRDRFNFYHTGIFLLDDKREYAVLRASPTEAGAKMLESNHRLRIGEQGIVGQVAATGEPRIALDVGSDAVYFNNPLLPATHSEMALPLKTAEGIIGVLDVQSDQIAAFNQDDIAIMQLMADQLATAIERIQLLHQVQNQLREIEQAYGNFTRQTWKNFTAQSGRQVAGYRFDHVRLEPISEPPASDETSAMVPIRLRGQTIGMVNVRFQNQQGQEKTIAMIEQISDRLSTALENARLLEETRQRAERDALISDLTGRFRSTLDLESVLRTAVQELQQAFRLKEAEVRLNLPAANAPERPAQETFRKNGKRHA
jgi:GAF domain-containing protein/HAMP domain-containing protein